MKFILLLAAILLFASNGESISCYDCENCRDFTETDLVICESSVTQCKKVIKSDVISRECGTTNDIVGCTEQGNDDAESTTCICDTDACNGAAEMEPLVVFYVILSTFFVVMLQQLI